MTKNEDGYATITVTAVLTGLSIIAVALLGHASAAASISDRVSTRLQLDASLEGRLQHVIADLINGKMQLRDHRLETSAKNNDRTTHITVSNEADKTDINRAELNEIDRRLKATVRDRESQSQIMKRIRAARAKSDIPFMSLGDVLDHTVSARDAACIRQNFTVFHTPNAFVVKRSDTRSLSGSLVRIQVETRDADTANRGIDSIILFSGDRKDPAWTMDWRRYSLPENGVCQI